MRIAFDVKGTLVGFNSAKVWHLFNILRAQGHEMFIWSNSFSYALDTLDAMGKEANGIVALTKYSEHEITNEDCHVMDLAVEDDTSQTWLAAKKFVFVHEIPEELEKIKEFASKLFL